MRTAHVICHGLELIMNSWPPYAFIWYYTTLQFTASFERRNAAEG